MVTNDHELTRVGEMEPSADELKRLQGCINDLISVLALTAVWIGRD
jgi:hypothetical protein